MKSGGKMLSAAGLLLIAAALFLSGYNLWDSCRAGQTAENAANEMAAIVEQTRQNETEDEPDYVLNPEMEMPTVELDGVEYIGLIEIPALSLSLPVISEWSYSGLKTAPCRYQGSVYLHNLIIAGHNYSTHFGTLKNLTEGEEITFTDTAGNVFQYTVAEVTTLNKTAVEEMESGEWDLTLFTCTVDGQARVTVRCYLNPDL